RTILQGAWPLAGSRRSGQFGPLAGRPGRHSMTVKAALCFADAGPAREGFREALGAVQPRTTLPERTDSHPATGADQTADRGPPAARRAPPHQGRNRRQRRTEVPAGGSGGSPPRAKLRAVGEASKRLSIGRRRVATGANHPASQSSAFRRGPGTPAGAPTGDQSTGLNSTPNPAPMHQSGNTSTPRFLPRPAPEHNRNIAADLPEPRLTAGGAFLWLMASATVIALLTWAGETLWEGLAGRGVTRRQVRFVCAETPGAVRLTSAVGEHNSEVWNHKGADR